MDKIFTDKEKAIKYCEREAKTLYYEKDKSGNLYWSDGGGYAIYIAPIKVIE